MNTFALRNEILSKTADEKTQLEMLQAAIMAGCDDPNARCMLSARFIQGMAGGIRDESGLISHIRNLEAVKKYGFGSYTLERHGFPVLNKVREKYRSLLCSELNLSETKFNNVTVGDEVEARLMAGRYDGELLELLIPKLEKLVATM